MNAETQTASAALADVATQTEVKMREQRNYLFYDCDI